MAQKGRDQYRISSSDKFVCTDQVRTTICRNCLMLGIVKMIQSMRFVWTAKLYRII